MVKNRTYIYYILFLSSCMDKNGIVFPETANLSVASEYNTDVHMRYPYRIRLTDSLIYVMDLHATEYYVHKMTYETEANLISSYGKKGEGPMELLDAENIRIDSGGRLWCLDANRLN